MQSGITASADLHSAFKTLISTPTTQRGLIAAIHSDEKLHPTATIPSTSPDFFTDISSLPGFLQDNEAAFVILRRYPDGVPDGVPDGSDGAPNGNASVSAPDKFICITYVPDTAPVRSKMLFASTRLTLVRELGSEKFAETRFVTSKGELGEEGWWRGKGRDDGSEDAGVPLTEGERTLKGVREAEAEEGSMGTRGRGAGFGGGGGGGVSFPVEGDALGALRGLGGSGSGSGGDNLVQLKINVSKESIELAGTSTTDAKGLASAISDTEPRYSFFRYTHEHEGQESSPIIFIYTCPSTSKVKERMMYASSNKGVQAIATNEAGLEIGKRMEASSPSEISPSTIHDELHPQQELKQTFSRPKRPGRR
ncbi:Twinfilin-1 [Bachmanniomyces sp. S44760]|nr:Twinfilin-1 [Bachmanniomyces sp. S44760]